jgi:hypothetical protein
MLIAGFLDIFITHLSGSPSLDEVAKKYAINPRPEPVARSTIDINLHPNIRRDHFEEGQAERLK